MAVRILLWIVIQVNHPPTHHSTPKAHTHIQTHTLISCFSLYRLRLVVWFPQGVILFFLRENPSPFSHCRVSLCTPERLHEWFADYSEFVHQHGLQGKTQCIWNADESGFPLVLKPLEFFVWEKRSTYSVHSDPKCQLLRLLQQVQQVVWSLPCTFFWENVFCTTLYKGCCCWCIYGEKR